jgi:hypothetical protein
LVVVTAAATEGIVAKAEYVVMVSSGVAETGLWCDRCLLPSRVRFPLYATDERGSGVVATYDECRECGAHPSPE